MAKYTETTDNQAPKKGMQDELIEAVLGPEMSGAMSPVEQLDIMPDNYKKLYQVYVQLMKSQPGAVVASPMQFIQMHKAMQQIYGGQRAAGGMVGAGGQAAPQGFTPAAGALGSGVEAGAMGGGLEALRTGRYSGGAR